MCEKKHRTIITLKNVKAYFFKKVMSIIEVSQSKFFLFFDKAFFKLEKEAPFLRLTLGMWDPGLASAKLEVMKTEAMTIMMAKKST